MSSANNALVIIATYNESLNIVELIDAIRSSSRADVLVVDDSSPDNTSGLVGDLALRDRRVRLIKRPSLQGLGSAIRTALAVGFAEGYDYVVNMDGDFSHDPTAVSAMVSEAAEADLVVGSRYVGGIRVMNWPARRLLLSLLASRYIRLVTGMEVFDPTSGFRCFRRSAIEVLIGARFVSRRFAFHIEALHHVWRAGLRVKELPITFRQRSAGLSKLSFRSLVDAGMVTTMLPFRSRFQLTNRTRNVPMSRAAPSRTQTYAENLAN